MFSTFTYLSLSSSVFVYTHTHTQSVHWGCHDNVPRHRLGGLKAEMYSLTVLEAGSPGSENRQGWFFLLAFSGRTEPQADAVLTDLWGRVRSTTSCPTVLTPPQGCFSLCLYAACRRCLLPLSPHGFPSVCVCVLITSFFFAIFFIELITFSEKDVSHVG